MCEALHVTMHSGRADLCTKATQPSRKHLCPPQRPATTAQHSLFHGIGIASTAHTAGGTASDAANEAVCTASASSLCPSTGVAALFNHECENLRIPVTKCSYWQHPAPSTRRLPQFEPFAPMLTLIEQEWLLWGIPLNVVVATIRGRACPLYAPDPRWMALHELWLSQKPGRSALKKPKDQRQGEVLLDATRFFLAAR